MTTDFEQYITAWIVNDLDKPVAVLNNMPKCPFAKKALLENKIQFYESSKNTIELIKSIVYNWTDDVEVAVLKIDNNISPTELSKIAIEANKLYSDFLVLDDHMRVEEKIQDVDFSNNKYNILLCQKRDKVEAARKSLHKAGYYKNWSEEYYNSVVSL